MRSKAIDDICVKLFFQLPLVKSSHNSEKTNTLFYTELLRHVEVHMRLFKLGMRIIKLKPYIRIDLELGRLSRVRRDPMVNQASDIY
jgi:hypothetical protein